jgi:hypothetical protein
LEGEETGLFGLFPGSKIGGERKVVLAFLSDVFRAL